MASPRSAGENGSADGVDAVGDAFRMLAQGLAQGLAQLQEALRLEKQEAERRMQEALRLQQERADTALREMERKLEEKDEAITALHHRFQETQDRLTALEERTTDQEGSGGGRMERLDGRMNDVEASLQSALETFMPRVEALLRQLEEPQSSRASVATAASTSAARARQAPATGGAAAAGGGEEPHSPTSTSSGAGHQGAAADEEERARQRVERRVREVKVMMEEARNSLHRLGEQLCEAAGGGRLTEVRRLIDSGVNVNYTNSNGYTPLITAAFYMHADVVSLLLQRGADANAVDGGGWSALHFAAAGRDRSGRCVELLLRAGADADAREEEGATPLHLAVCSNNEEAVRALLAAGARRDLKPWGERWKDKTPIDIAKTPQVRDLLRY